MKGDTLMSEAYKNRKDPDGFLYITYTDETTLGAEESQWCKYRLTKVALIYFFILSIS